jgi:hypothetical protein
MVHGFESIPSRRGPSAQRDSGPAQWVVTGRADLSLDARTDQGIEPDLCQTHVHTIGEQKLEYRLANPKLTLDRFASVPNASRSDTTL